MYKISRWAAQDRSGRVNWLLTEMNVQFELETLDYKIAHDDPEYRRVHPLGQSPVIRDLRSDETLFESGAICLYLADKHADRELLPSDRKALCYQWVMYNYASLEPVVSTYFDIDESDGNASEKKDAIDEKVKTLLVPVEQALSKSKFICGDVFTVADIPLGQTIFWLRNRPVLNQFPKTKEYLSQLKNRPAAKKAGLFTEWT